MVDKSHIKRRKSDFGGRYRPVTGTSTHPDDLEYVRRNVPCQWACPAYTDIPGYIKAIHEGNYAKAYTINSRSNLFPGILGRVCSRPCERYCRHGDADLGESVNICSLKRVAADFRQRDYHLSERVFGQTSKKVAIVGGGPAGLAAAHSLAILGHRVAIYEAKPKLGGMMLYGIPDFRVPPTLVEEEIYNIIRMGVQVTTGVRLGVDFSLDKLKKKYDAVIIAIGCYRQKRLNVPGEDLPQVFSGLDFMVRLNEGDPLPVGKKVAVVGGGFTAMDCSRSAIRLGAEQVVNYIRRTEEDIPVSKEEIYEAKKEGVQISSLVTPTAIDGEDSVEGVRFVRNRLVAGDSGAGKKPEAIMQSDFVRNVDTVIVAIGQAADLSPADSRQSLENMGLGATSDPTVFLAGDCCHGSSSIIEAIGQAQQAAAQCDQFLMGKKRSHWTVICKSAADTTRERAWDFIPTSPVPSIDVDTRLVEPAAEVELGFTVEQAKTEAARCYLCNLRYKIHTKECIYCRWCIDLCPRNCIHMVSDLVKSDQSAAGLLKTNNWRETVAIVIDSERCIRCGECLRICPTQCIHVTTVGLKNLFKGGREQVSR